MIEEELVFVPSPATDPTTGRSPIATSIDEAVVLQGPRDVVGNARCNGEPPCIVDQRCFDVTAISAVKSLVENGDGATVMPYGTVIADVNSGRLKVRRIVDPPLKRTLYLARSSRRAQFKREPALDRLPRQDDDRVCRRMGTLAQRLPTLDAPLSQAVGRVAERAGSEGAGKDCVRPVGSIRP